MNHLAIYNQPLALLTDLYQLTMAHGYFRSGRDQNRSVFHLFFRRHPFKGGFTVSCGLNQVIDFLCNFRFTADDIAYLDSLKGNDGKHLFEQSFLKQLKDMEPAWDLDAVPEGTLVFPHQPMLRIRGPIWQCQLLETALLNIMNFQSLIATKALRVVAAARGDSVLEFGLRRAQGIDGALSASYAAYVGGCAGTSNVLAGRLFGIPVKGTHAHSWVMSFDDELTSFEAYANAMPNNCVFLVDTYDTISGVRKAIQVGQKLKQRGFRMAGIRLDSGDLELLSKQARAMLDDAGFADAAIVASNDLDEQTINELKENGAQIAIWGVGTKLVTAYDQPALGGVYKLAAMNDGQGNWQAKLKLSEESIKVSNPGPQQVLRYQKDGKYVGDILCTDPPQDNLKSVIAYNEPFHETRLPEGATSEPLLKPVFRSGKLVGERESIDRARQRVQDQFKMFPDAAWHGVGDYLVGLAPALHAQKMALIETKRNSTG